MRTVLIAATAFAWASLSNAAGAQTALQAVLDTYCEPLMAGGPAAPLEAKARTAGFGDVTVMGQPMLRSGEILLRLSDSPRVCFIQAPAAMSFAQGAALVDAWAAKHPDSVRAPAQTGPDGRPVRAWSDPKSRTALLATEQPDGAGGTAVNLVLMPLP